MKGYVSGSNNFHSTHGIAVSSGQQPIQDQDVQIAIVP